MPEPSGLSSVRALFRSKFVRNVAVLMTGTAVSQVILLLVSPVLSRLYAPEAFGLFSLFVAIAALVGPVIHMQYGQAIVLPKDDRDAGALFFLGNAIVLAISALSLIVIAFAHDAIAGLVNAPALAGWLWWIPGLLLLMGVCDVLELWATRRKRYWSISNRRIVRSVAQVTVQLSAGAAKPVAGGLIAGTLVGQASETLTLGAQVAKRDSKLLRDSFSLTQIRKVAGEYRMFPQYGAPGALLNSVSQSIPTFVLAAFFGTGLVGLFGMTMRVLVYPSSFVTASIRQVLFQRAAETHAKGESNLPMFRKTTLWLAVIALVPAICVMIAGPRLFSVVLGAEWYDAGVYARWLVLWIACGVMNVPASAVLQVLKRQRLLMIIEIALIVSRVVALLVPSLLGSASAAIAAYAGVGVVFNVGLIVGADAILRREHRALGVSS
jgi:lipopolysaccharide exporter